jgi:UDP:flavonoid glycosyltransferase YjiC (YdhE family)
MKRIIISVGISAVEALGSVTRMVAIADHVRRINPKTKILFRAAGSEAEHVKKHGFSCRQGYKPNIYGMPGPLFRLMQAMPGKWNGKIPDLKRMEHIIRLKGMFTNRFVKTTFAEWKKLIQEFKPDAIVSEFDLVLPIAARKHNIKLYTTMTTPGLPSYYCELFYKKPHPDRSLCRYYNHLLRSLQLPPIKSVLELFMGYDQAHWIIPSLPELEDIPVSPKYNYVGSLIPRNFAKTSWKWNKTRPLIYVYLSIGQISAEQAEQELVAAFGNTGFDVLVAGAGHPYFEEKGGYSQGNVHFFTFIPSDRVLRQADLAIHHGGQNTTLQCIKERVPALIFPGRHFERYFNARKAEHAGCALCCSNRDFKSGKLKDLAGALLNNKNISHNLRRYARKIKRLGGARRAAEIILGR